MNSKKNKIDVNKILKKLWSNYIFRNIVLFISLVVIFFFVVSLLLNIFTRHNSYRSVPEFVGVTLDDAYALAKRDKLHIEINDSIYIPYLEPGVVVDQKPAAGVNVKSGRRVFLVINSTHQKIVDVPYVVGYSLRQAKSIIESAGLEIDKLVYINDIATNNVLLQHINGEEVTDRKPIQAEAGSGIVLTVGRSYDATPVLVPRLAGMSLREAKSRLRESGLNVGKEITDKGINTKNIHTARVYKHHPENALTAELGSQVAIYLTLDSLTIANGIIAAENRVKGFARHRHIVDSLANEGYYGDDLRIEADVMVMNEKFGISNSDIQKNLTDLLREANERVVKDKKTLMDIPDEISDKYDAVEVEIDIDEFFDNL